MSAITYKGVTTEISDNLFERPIVKKNNPKKSYQFGSLSLYYDGVHYFPADIKESLQNHCDKPYEVQGVFYQGKWRQDTFYITEDFKNFLLKFI